MMHHDLSVRSLNSDDAAAGYTLSTAAGWNQTIEDWKFMLGSLPVQGYVALAETEVVGTALSINYTDQYSWIAMVLVHEQYRRKGIAHSLMKLLLNDLGVARCIELDATSYGKDLYASLGFYPKFEIIRFTKDYFSVSELSQYHGVKDPGAVALADQMNWGIDRKSMIHHLQSFVQGNNYISYRQGRVFTQIGPLCAEDIRIAKKLCIDCLQIIPGDKIAVDVVCWQIGFISWLISIGFVEQRRFERMYAHHAVSSHLRSNQYLIAGPEFG